MIEKGKLIFKFWFKNGTYIEKEMVLDENTSKEEIEGLNENLPRLKEIVAKSFRENLNADLNINNLTVRCSKLIAFDIILIVEEQHNADL